MSAGNSLTVCRFGFRLKWRKWIKTCISTTSFAVIMNGGPSSFFHAFRGLKQADPLSPLLFTIVMEALNKLLERARDLKLVEGIILDNNRDSIEVTHLFFVDDSLIFCKTRCRNSSQLEMCPPLLPGCFCT